MTETRAQVAVTARLIELATALLLGEPLREVKNRRLGGEPSRDSRRLRILGTQPRHSNWANARPVERTMIDLRQRHSVTRQTGAATDRRPSSS